VAAGVNAAPHSVQKFIVPPGMVERPPSGRN